MSLLTYSFDLGTNSIGWAILRSFSNNDHLEIVQLGSNIFPAGVNVDPKNRKETSKNEKRRLFRQARKNKQRRRFKKTQIARLLAKHELFPDFEEWEELQANRQASKFQVFFALAPYQLRAKAFRGEQLSLLEIGRIIYQFAQRRGYRPSLKTDLKDASTLNTGDPTLGKAGINATSEGIDEHGSLGNFLAQLNPHETRIRNRYTTRQMFVDEFEIIWESQQAFYPTILTDELKQKIGHAKTGLLFYQQPLKSQKHLLGKCTFETNKSKHPKSSPEFEDFRMWQHINQLEIGNAPLNPEERETVARMFLSKNKIKLAAILKKLKRAGESCNYPKEHTFPSNKTQYYLQQVFGKSQWEKFTHTQKMHWWQMKYIADDPEKFRTYIEKNTHDLSEKSIQSLLYFKLEDDYSNLSRKAINHILPYLKKEYLYDDAVMLAGIERTFGTAWHDELSNNDREHIIDTAIAIKQKAFVGGYLPQVKQFLQHEYALTDKQLKKLYHHSQVQQLKGGETQLPDPENVRNPIVGQVLFELKNLTNQLIKEWGIPDTIKVEMAREMKKPKSERENIFKFQRENERKNDTLRERLESENVPVNRRNLQKLRLWHESHEMDVYSGNKINIEELFGEKPLYEVEHIIPRSISLNDSMGNKTLCHFRINQEKGNKTPFQYFQSQPDEWKAVCVRAKKHLKNHKFKRFVSKENPDADNFISRQLNDTAYISRQASQYLQQICSDVQVISGGVTAELRHQWGANSLLHPRIFVSEWANGNYAIAIDRKHAVKSILAVERGEEKQVQEILKKKGIVLVGKIWQQHFYPSGKNRHDHRHHALDALILACTERRWVQALARKHALREGNYLKDDDIPKFELPWLTFRHDAQKALKDILVYHKKRTKIFTKIRKKIQKNGQWVQTESYAARGPLHKETVYGRHEQAGQTYFHIRKSLDALETHKHVQKIVDERIRLLVRQRLEEYGVDVHNSKGYTIPKNKPLFFSTHPETKERIPLLFMPNKNGAPIPIKKVRIREKSDNNVQLRDKLNQWVAPRNNHHIEIYEDEDGKLSEQVITFWEAVERKRNKQSVLSPDTTSRKLVCTLQKNDLFILGWHENERGRIETASKSDLSQHLYRVQKIGEKNYTFRHHLASSIQFDVDRISIQSMSAWAAQCPIKVVLSRTGKLKRHTI